MHHHRAEVAHVGHDVARRLVADALVGTQPRVFLGEAVPQVFILRRQDARLRQIEPQLGGTRPHSLLVAENGEGAHAAL